MTTQITMDTVKAALKTVEQKRAIKDRLEKQAEAKIKEAKERAEKQYGEKLTAAEKELADALAALDETYTSFKTGKALEAAEGAAPEESQDVAI